MYLIEILHQTTTFPPAVLPLIRCILSKFYIKPQRSANRAGRTTSCILSKFYIKPQHSWRYVACGRVVSYRNSTSNHNKWPYSKYEDLLYLIEILHQTTTLATDGRYPKGCILSKFYIKPQPDEQAAIDYCVVSYRNSTSNHNISAGGSSTNSLYLIEILHQTTTRHS